MDRLTFAQWNARGLRKSRLEEFRNFLSLLKPSICLLNETFWNENTNVKFQSYHIVKKNRTDRPGGGVAILIHKSIPFFELILPSLTSIEAVGVTIITNHFGPVDTITAYCPKGDCTKEEVTTLLDRNHQFIVGGDLNGHHSFWSSTTRPNRSGKSIYSALLEIPDANLITPKNMATYINPGTGCESTIDLTFMSSTVSADSTIQTGPYMGSDHLPIIVTTILTPKDVHTGTPRWVFSDKWPEWNKHIEKTLTNANFSSITAPEPAYQLFRDAILDASNIIFSKSQPNKSLKAEPCRPWWNADCKRAVASARKALSLWRTDPCSKEKRAAWQKEDAIKRKIIIQAKKLSWEDFITSLNPQESHKKMWSFVKSMTGRSGQSLSCKALKTDNGSIITDPVEKVNIFLDTFFDETEHPRNPDPVILKEIEKASCSSETTSLNSTITMEEVIAGLQKLKSNSTGKDDNHNKMLANLNPTNIKHMQHLFNVLLVAGVVPQDWKEAVVIPLPKPNKPTDDPKSYRPISLTSCLGKVMERIITRRLNWYLESHNLLQKNQAGFR